MEYRVYERVGIPTYFRLLSNGNYKCTHGGWEGTPCTSEEKPALDYGGGTVVYDSFRDLTEEEYNTEYNDYVS